MDTQKKAVLYIVLSVFFFSCMQLAVSMTSEEIGVMEQVFFRNCLCVLVAYYFIRKNGVSLLGERKYQPALFGRSFFGFVGIALLFYASRNAFLADATILNRTGPFFTTIFSLFFLKEKISKIQIPALLIVFTGGFIAANPKFDSSFIPLACALASSVCNGICYTLLHFFKGKVDGMTVILHFSLFSMIAAIPFMIGNFVMPTGLDILMLALIGIFGSLGQIAVTYAYRMAPASQVSIYDQLSIVFAIIFGWIFLQQIPKVNSLIGGTLVIISSIMVYLYNNKASKTAEVENTKKSSRIQNIFPPILSFLKTHE